MMNRWLSVLLLAACVLFAGTAPAAAVTIDDVILHYKFDDTSGTVFADSGNNNNDATFYRFLKYPELPAVDASYVTTSLSSVFGSAMQLGTKEIGVPALSHEVMIQGPTTSAALPEPGDSFAVSFWLNMADWDKSYGVLSSYSAHGLKWVIGMHDHSTVQGMCVYTDDVAYGSGPDKYSVNLAGLTDATFAHFVVQFGGDAGISNVYVNGVATGDSGSTQWFWPSEKEAFCVDGRVLSTRNFTAADCLVDDFAVIPGVVTQTQVDSIRTLGVANSGVAATVHYALDESAGATVADSSGNGLHGELVGFDNTQLREARSVAPAMVPGKFGTALEIGGKSFWYDHAKVETPTNMPHLGEAFTAMFWLKTDKWNWSGYGGAGVLFSQWLGDYALTIGGNDTSVPDSLLVKSGTGDTSIDMAGVSTAGLPDNEFVHFAITIDDAGMITAIYVNGDLGTPTTKIGYNFGAEGVASLGLRILNTGELDKSFALDCELDDFAFIKSQLTEAQIEYAMQHGVEALYSGVIQIPGDASGNGSVGPEDAQILAAHWGGSGGWSEGDFNDDGFVNAADASILAANWGYGASEGAVPEPGMAVLAFGLLVGASLWRRRRTDTP